MYQGMLTVAMSCLLASSLCSETEVQQPKAIETTYTTYLALSQNIEESAPKQIEAFLKTAKETPYAKYIRQQWLKKLFTEKRWQEYIDFYKPTNSAAIECGYLTALYHTGKQQLALNAVSRLWLVANSQPKQCDSIFKLWQQADLLTQDLIWQRFELAIDVKNYRLARHLTTLLPKENTDAANLWLKISKKPKLLLKTTFQPTPLARKIIATGLAKLADKNPTLAIKLWKKFKTKHNFTKLEKQKIIRAITLELALRQRKNAIYWFAKFDISPDDVVMHEWRIRTALSHQNWVTLKKHFESLPNDIKQKNCWRYWYARALHKTGERSEARKLFSELATGRHYYGFLSSEHLQQKNRLHHRETKINPIILKKVKSHANVQLAKSHLNNKKFSQARTAWHHAVRQFDENEKYHAAKIAADWGWHEQAILTAKRLENRNDLILRFPTPHKKMILNVANKHQIHPAFLFAIIRQESSFQHDAHSPNGARGVMQLLPKTAADYKRKMHPNLLYDVNHNIILGAKHIKRMLKQFRGKYIYVAASYNAGQTQVKKWLRHRPTRDVTIWIDTLPWAETRNYIKNVLTYFVIYQYHLGKDTNIGNILKIHRYYD